jgi:hypothetical protein
MDKTKARHPAKDAPKPAKLTPEALQKVVGGSVHGGTVGV